MESQLMQYTMDKVAQRLPVMSEDWLAYNQRMKAYISEAFQILGETLDQVIDGECTADDLKDALDKTRKALLYLIQESETRRKEFANIASLGSPEAWRLFATVEKIDLPESWTGQPEEVAQAIIQQYLNLPQLTYAIADLVSKQQEDES